MSVCNLLYLRLRLLHLVVPNMNYDNMSLVRFLLTLCLFFFSFLDTGPFVSIGNDDSPLGLGSKLLYLGPREPEGGAYILRSFFFFFLASLKQIASPFIITTTSFSLKQSAPLIKIIRPLTCFLLNLCLHTILSANHAKRLTQLTFIISAWE